MMNVTYAKSIFSEKTICFQMSYLLKELQLDKQIDTSVQYDSKWHQFNVVLQRIVTVSHHIRNYDIIPAINLLEYQVAVYGIYIERFMNANWKLTKSNIDEEEDTIKTIIQFFYKWYATEVHANRGDKITSRLLESRYIAEQTHNNMNVLCKGYLEYARYILTVCDDNEYVPALHSSQSSIENHFSCVRSIGKDRTDLYGTAIVQMNIKAKRKSIRFKGNSSYEAEQSVESDEHTFDIIRVKH